MTTTTLEVNARASELAAGYREALHRRIDRLFAATESSSSLVLVTNGAVCERT